MKLKWIFLAAAAFTLVLASGCVSTLDGRRSAGWPVGDDTIDARYERAPAELWAATKDVLRFHGTVTSEDTLKSVIQANVDTRRVWVRIGEHDTKTTLVSVQVRTQGGASDLQMASFIDKQIAVRLATGNLTPAAPVK
jgi:hypothetical protein